MGIKKMIDLHCHSHFSDGLLSPSALLDKALLLNVQILALTDHDSTDGLADLHAAAHQRPIKIINGIEISVRWKKHDIHVLGLNISPQSQTLMDLIAVQAQSRTHRAQQIGERLKDCGLENAYQKARLQAGHEHVGRPHFAQVLVEEGKAIDLQQAFRRFLVRGRPAYIETAWASLEYAVLSIIAAGGQAVIAHPLKYKFTRSKLRQLLTEFKATGGEGLEVVSGAMSALQAREMAELCSQFELLASSGSDYHGDGLSRVALGQQHALPLNCLPIWERWAGATSSKSPI